MVCVAKSETWIRLAWHSIAAIALENPGRAVSPNEVVQQIAAFASESTEPCVAIPTSDAMVLALCENDLPNNLIVYDAIRNGLAAKAVDKQSFYDLCRQADITTPQTAFPNSADDVLELGKSFQFPLLLKPIFGHLWREKLRGHKLVVAENQTELEKYVEQFGEDCQGLMVQELIPGTETNIYVAAIYRGRAGNRDFCFVAEKTRQYPVDFGSASLATAKMNEEIRDLSWKFLEGVDYRGICGTEFKLDPRDNQFKMIEVNPRPTLWFHLAHCSGVELIHGMVMDLLGENIPSAKPQHEGTRWCSPRKGHPHLDSSPEGERHQSAKFALNFFAL